MGGTVHRVSWWNGLWLSAGLLVTRSDLQAAAAAMLACDSFSMLKIK
jgi:hypothetical protein